MDRTSLFKMTTLPDAFGVVLLVFSFILMLVPYFSGTDFGLFKVPTVGDGTKKVLKVIGPVLFISIILLFIPAFVNNKQVIIANTEPTPVTPSPQLPNQPTTATVNTTNNDESKADNREPLSGDAQGRKRESGRSKNIDRHSPVQITVNQSTGTTEIKGGGVVITVTAPTIKVLVIQGRYPTLGEVNVFPISAVITVDGKEYVGRRQSEGNFKFPAIPCDENLAPKKEMNIKIKYPGGIDPDTDKESKMVIDCKDSQINIDLSNSSNNKKPRR